MGLKSLIPLLIVAALGAGAYALSTSGLLDTSTQITTFETDIATLESEVLVRVGQINAINLDTSIFTRSDYKALKDIGAGLPTPVVSRQDPFAGL